MLSKLYFRAENRKKIYYRIQHKKKIQTYIKILLIPSLLKHPDMTVGTMIPIILMFLSPFFDNLRP